MSTKALFKREFKMNSTEKAELKKEILKVTPAVVAPKKVKQAPAPKMSKKAVEAIAVLKSMPRDWVGSDRDTFLTKAFETLLGEKLVVAKVQDTSMSSAPRIDKMNLRKFQAIVPEANPNSHDYALGEVVILLQNDGKTCLKSNGTHGNSISRSSCRYATRPEIDAFLDKLQKTANVEEVARNFEKF